MTKSTITIRRERTKVILIVDGRETVRECLTECEACIMYRQFKERIEAAEYVSNHSNN